MLEGWKLHSVCDRTCGISDLGIAHIIYSYSDQFFSFRFRIFFCLYSGIKFPCVCVCIAFSLSISWWTSMLIQCPCSYEKAAINTDEQVSLLEDMESFECVFKSGTAGSYVISRISLLRNLHVNFHADSTSLYSHQQWIRILHPHSLCSLCFLMLAILTAMRRNLRVIFVCLSLMDKNAKHLSKYLMYICIYYFYLNILLKIFSYNIFWSCWHHCHYQNNNSRFPSMAYDFTSHEFLVRFIVPCLNSSRGMCLTSIQSKSDWFPWKHSCHYWMSRHIFPGWLLF